jgi:ketosteroid isomerase-like protein
LEEGFAIGHQPEKIIPDATHVQYSEGYSGNTQHYHEAHNMNTQLNGSEHEIRDVRERFNVAIANKDAKTIQNFLAPTYHIITGRSAQNHGATEEAKRWADVFSQDPTAVYRRTPREIRVNEAWGIAEELGDWKGSYTAENVLVQASGVYAAKWQRAENGEWLLQVEVFTTMECSGPESGCVKPDPIYVIDIP